MSALSAHLVNLGSAVSQGQGETIPKHTPWGHPQSTEKIADGVVFFDTASHGGYWLSSDRRSQMTDEVRDIPTFAGGNWYEEDCDACLVPIGLPHLFESGQVDHAREFFAMCESRGMFSKRGA